MTDLSGSSIGRYHILEPLGQGGMASVYKAFDTRLEREVAVKIIRKEAFGAEVIQRILERFDREAKSLARLSHPNIVKIYDSGDHEGSPYLVMEYIPAGTLKQFLGQPMDYRQAARLLAPVARALAYAHRQGIIHRDVKPANILITESGEPMLSDFGIARILSGDIEKHNNLTATGVGIGTPEYMAPEQGLGKQVDPRADIYSLGIVFYELVTGRKPYTADTPMAVLLMQMTDPLPRPRLYVPKLPVEVERVMLKALAKQPEDRYPQMEDLAGALEKLSAGYDRKASLPARIAQPEAPQAPPSAPTAPETRDEFGITSPPPRPTSASRRLPPWAWVGIGAGIILVLVASILLVQAAGAPVALAPTPSPTPTFTLSPSETASLQPTAAQPPSPTATQTASPTFTPTASPTETPTLTSTVTPIMTPTTNCGSVAGTWNGQFQFHYKSTSGHYYMPVEYSAVSRMEIFQEGCQISGKLYIYFKDDRINVGPESNLYGYVINNLAYITTDSRHVDYPNSIKFTMIGLTLSGQYHNEYTFDGDTYSWDGKFSFTK